MKYFKIAGLCLASVLAMGMALAGNASAALLWLLCLEGSGLTKYSSNQCTEASSTGKWQSLGIAAGVKDTVRLLAFSLRLEDTGTGAIVECPDVGLASHVKGYIEGANKGSITAASLPEAEKEGCKVLKGFLTCTAGTLEKVEGVGLPWTTEIFETNGKNLSKIASSSKPGWAVTCSGVKDTCEEETAKPEFVELVNGVTNGILLVLSRFIKANKAKCSLGGAGTGIVGGLTAILLGSGNGLSITSL